MLGRAFDLDDEKPGRDKTAVLSFELWQRRFGGDRAIVGKTITLEGGKRTVVGVMRAFRDLASAVAATAQLSPGFKDQRISSGAPGTA